MCTKPLLKQIRGNGERQTEFVIVDIRHDLFVFLLSYITKSFEKFHVLAAIMILAYLISY